MANIAQIKETLTTSDFETIEEMAGQNYGPSDIARALTIPCRGFMHIWRDKKSLIRESYNRGILQMDITKSEKIQTLITEGNITALQIHEKKAKQRAFQDIKADVFGL